jgi:hypothetical protein
LDLNPYFSLVSDLDAAYRYMYVRARAQHSVNKPVSVLTYNLIQAGHTAAGLTFYSFEQLKQLLLDYCPICRVEDVDGRQVSSLLLAFFFF